MAQEKKTRGNQGAILLAEDDENDVLLTLRVFGQAHFVNPVRVVSDGEQAIAYFRGEGEFAQRDEYPLPALLLLDLKMPRKDGFAVLQWLRQQPQLSALRIVVLTGSDRAEDAERARQLGANSVLVKPLDFPHFVEATRGLTGFWSWRTDEPESSGRDEAGPGR